MKRFRLSIGLLIATVIVTVGAAVWLFLSGLWAQGCMVAILTGVCIALIWNLQTKLIRMMSVFVSALEMNDTTLRIDAGGDEELKEMSAAMNRISQLYNSNLRELETRKLYYDRILKIMTHEMRNGITPLIAITADMQNHPERYQGATLTEASQLLNNQINGIKRFLDSYYNLTHLPEPKPELIKAGDYFKVLKHLALSELQQRGMRPDTVSFTVPEDMELNIDIALMNQVMLNLLRNALDAVADLGEGRVEVVLTVSEKHPYFTVTDNGPGIPPEIISNLFQPFFTTKEGGSGIGLCLCRQIIRRQGGDLILKSQPGRGTVVIIAL